MSTKNSNQPNADNFEIAVFQDEVRSLDLEIILIKAREKMAIKYGRSFNCIPDFLFSITPYPDKQFHWIQISRLELQKINESLNCGLITDICKILIDRNSK